MEEHATALADAIEAVLPGWVERSVRAVLAASGTPVTDEMLAAANDAGQQAAADVGGEMRALLALDVDEQHDTPLTLLRAAVRYPTAVLRDAGVPPVVRDEFKARAFPDDAYDLAPASFADVDPSLADLGIAWGAAKAHTHMARHRGDGARP